MIKARAARKDFEHIHESDFCLIQKIFHRFDCGYLAIPNYCAYYGILDKISNVFMTSYLSFTLSLQHLK